MRLTYETIKDIGPLLLQFVFVLATSGIIMYYAEQNKKYGEEDEIVHSLWNSYFLFDALWNAYMSSLGEYGDQPAAFNNHPQKHGLYFLFGVTTFFTQIVFLNMIIAQMSDTFEKLHEQKPKIALQ